ncbi:Maf family protein [Pleomorphomonas koreensis]|uniref:Maf family protein n=1 Tax=Pleomorphomonas koreensis TaxID=257440 RepID=UPI00040D6D3E|nr:Maf family protein [Pleomorphomonas koreensis]
MSLILASASPARAALLTGAGLIFKRVPADVDERLVEEDLGGLGAADVAQALADVKAVEVSMRRPGDLVIGADQTLALGDERFHKPRDREEAGRQLTRLSGRSHELHSALSLARGGEVLHRAVDSARLTMRPLSARFISHYLAVVGEAAVGSVGAYQLEGYGVQLFSAVDGNHFTILGLPLLPLLHFLREEGVIER